MRFEHVRAALVLVAAFVLPELFTVAAQSVDVITPTSAPHLRASDARTPHVETAPLPVQNFTVSRGIGILEDDGKSLYPGFPSPIHGQETWRATPTANNTFILKKVAYQFDDPSAGTVIYDGAKRPIVGFLDANYIPPHYTLPAPFTFAGKQYTKLSISTWGAIAFGDADSTQVNYDPTVVSNMFRVPMVAVWYELFYYPSNARVIARNKANSVVITWQNVLSRHSPTPCTFQAELFFDSGEIQLSYQTLPVPDGLVGFSTGTEAVTHQATAAVSNPDIPAYLQAASASFDNYGGIIAGVTLKVNAPIPVPAAGESFRYTLLINGLEVIALEYTSSQSILVVVPVPKIPEFPGAQIQSWETKLSGDTLSVRMPATSLVPYLSTTGTSTWAIKSTRFGGAGFLERTITQTLPLNFTVRQSLLPTQIDAAGVEVPAEIFHYTPDVWDTDRIRESIAAYLVSRGQSVDSFRFFPTSYDDGLKHSNYAGTYPRQKSVTGAGQIPARTECDCHYGAEFSSVSESLGTESTTQIALTHELGHECVFYADYKDVDGVVKGPWRDAGVPCFGGAHPNNGLANESMFADSESGLKTISVMGGSVGGVYQLTAPRFGFSRVEMYFLGLASPAEVTPITFVQSSGTSQITIDQVVAANGVRTPSYGGQQKVFRVPAFVVKRQEETVSDAQLQQLQNLLFRWQSRFWRETGGRARSNTTLDGGCSYTLSASSVKIVSDGSTGSVNVFVEPGCTVTASTTDPWISVNVNGAGAASYVVGPNASGNARNGTITIAGQPFTVNQYGKGRREAAGH